MKIPAFTFFLLTFSLTLSAQYYYNDIVVTKETNLQMKTFLINKVKSVTATGYDNNGVKETNFAEVQEVKENGNALRVSTTSNFNHTVLFNRFDSQKRLTSIIDSSADILSKTSYQYDSQGKISSIQNIVKDSTSDFNQTEIHNWFYSADGKPEKMWRIINGTDSLEILLSTDEDGNIGYERTYKKGVETGAIYYYHDEKKRLTDIVRYQSKLKRLIPDIMFEYDDYDRVIQKITTTSSLNMKYLIWRYIFNTKGLKTKEALFNHKKEITGKIEYAYIFE